MIPNKKITEDEFHDLITWRKLTYGGEAIICESDNPYSLYKIFTNLDKPKPMSESKEKKIELLHELKPEYSIQPISTISLNDVIAHDKDGGDITLIDVLEEHTESLDKITEYKDNIMNLSKYLNVLGTRELEIIKMRYGLLNTNQKTQKEIAKKLHISRSYVSRIEKRALIKMLREFIRNNNI